MPDIAAQLAQVQTQIATACARAGRDAASVTLIGVSKTQPNARVIEATAAGLQHFGENRVEEASIKIPVVNAAVAQASAEPPVWHLIGHLQSRKAKDLFATNGQPLFDVFHALDSVKVGAKLSALAVERGCILEVLLQMNVSGEVSKEGFAAAIWQDDNTVRAQLWGDFSALRALPGLRIAGLMT
ncbi:MAG: alanine racemase, partial [Armatimonadetes bacterium]|nr:alanine racemase [Anaerolineae bacterium]